MLTRRLALPALVLLCALTACTTPEPAETPTPTLTLSDQALAYSAAEEAWNEYVTRMGEVDLKDQATVDRFLETLSGDLRDDVADSYEQMMRDDWTTSGKYHSLLFEASEWNPDSDAVVGRACLDVHEVVFLDATGKSQVKETRHDIQNVGIGFDVNPESWTATITVLVNNADGSTC